MHNRAAVDALVDRLFQERVSWPELIKQIRVAAEVDLLTAERLALAHPGWRRLIGHRINHEDECKKLALSHMKQNGQEAIISAAGAALVVKADRVLN